MITRNVLLDWTSLSDRELRYYAQLNLIPYKEMYSIDEISNVYKCILLKLIGFSYSNIYILLEKECKDTWTTFFTHHYHAIQSSIAVDSLNKKLIKKILSILRNESALCWGAIFEAFLYNYKEQHNVPSQKSRRYMKDFLRIYDGIGQMTREDTNVPGISGIRKSS